MTYAEIEACNDIAKLKALKAKLYPKLLGRPCAKKTEAQGKHCHASDKIARLEKESLA